MKHKVGDLEGTLLNQAVAIAMGLKKIEIVEGWIRVYESPRSGLGLIDAPSGWMFAPSTHWQCGGTIIEHERITIEHEGDLVLDDQGRTVWTAGRDDAFSMERGWSFGHTPLIAAMRFYVRTKLGEEIELPG